MKILNMLKLILQKINSCCLCLLFWRFIRFLGWLVNVFVFYFWKRNIISLIIVLGIFFAIGFLYSSYRIGHDSRTPFPYFEEPNIHIVCEGLTDNNPKEKQNNKNQLTESSTDKTNASSEEKRQKNLKKLRALKWCLMSMFDPSFAISNFRFHNNWLSWLDGILALLLLLITWLIGGGGLISSIVTTMHESHHGAWRKWGWLLWNHSLIIGWNSNAPTIIREHIKKTQLLIKILGVKVCLKRLERLVVITSGDAFEISEILKSIIGGPFDRLCVTYDIYFGSYDSDKEIKGLAVHRANAVYVFGDEGEPAHDARVKLWPKLVEDKVIEGREERPDLYCALNIESYGLFCQHQRKGWTSSRMDVNFFNFYDSWAKRLFARLDVKENIDHVNSTSRAEIQDYLKNQPPHIIIIGFTEMGQAILAELARDCHYDLDDNVIITVIDEDISERCAEFTSIYPRIEEIPDIYIDWIKVDKLGSAQFLLNVERLISDEKQTTIVIANDDPSVAMKLALPIEKMIQEKNNVKILIRQAVRGLYKDLRVTNRASNDNHLVFFGMLDGAGFGMRRRDDIVEQMVSESGIDRSKCFQSFREKVDALSQILAGLGIEVWSLAAKEKEKDKDNKLVFDHGVIKDNDTFDKLAKAYHKHWCACYLLSDDGSGITDTASDYRLVNLNFNDHENDNDKVKVKVKEEVYKELRLLIKALGNIDLCLVKRVHNK